MGIIGTIAAVLGGVGIAEGINAMSHTPSSPAQPTLPSQTTAASTASGAQTAQRQAALAAGSNTNVTGGSGIILGSDISSVTLVGSG